MSTIKPQTLKGFRDFLPKEAKKRQFVINALKEVFELYGFEPLETPALEYEEVLLGKYGDEGDKLMYRFTDNGDRKVALRYDQTVPLARVVAQYGDKLPTPFKRYQIQPVWRAENPQKGRFREFLQCDADIVGSSSLLSDAELIALTYKSLLKLGFKNIKIFLNTKDLLYGLMEQAKIPRDKWQETAMSLDKLNKIGEGNVTSELVEKRGVAKGCVEELFRVSNALKAIPNSKSLTNLNTILINFEFINRSLKPLKEITKYTYSLGVPLEVTIPRFTLARGLDYYTGMIFEVEIDGYTAGSVCGGGRYDTLIGMFAGKLIPAVGFAFGFDRLIEAMEQLNLFPTDLTTTKVLVTVFSEELLPKSIEICSLLRASLSRAKSRDSKNINTELWLDTETKLDKQLKYANQKGIPYVVVIGPDEAKNNQVTVKNMQTGKQETIPQDKLLKYFS